MYTSMYQNSYVILIITFIMLSIIFYLFEIGYNKEIIDGKINRKFSWKYPLAISLIVWVFCHFYLYPPAEELSTQQTAPPTNYPSPRGSSPIQTFLPGSNKLLVQKINMINWN